MGKNLISQRRGKGSTTFRAPSFKWFGEVKYHSQTEQEREGVLNGVIKDIVHSSGHSSPLMVVEFENKKTALLIAPEGVRVGDTIMSGAAALPNKGCILPLIKIPEGTEIFNIESQPGDGGRYARSSGSTARVISKQKGKVLVELPSKKIKEFHTECRATIGSIAGFGRVEKPLVKAGNNYFKKKAKNKVYPRVRGVAMNAVDHPYGSGRGSHKGKPTIAPRWAPPGAKVGKLRPRRTGMKR